MQKKVESILTWPKDLLSQIIYIILYPFHLIYWLIMPNIYHKPEIIKVSFPKVGTYRYPFQLCFLHWIRLCTD